MSDKPYSDHRHGTYDASAHSAEINSPAHTNLLGEYLTPAWEFTKETAAHPDKRWRQACVLSQGISKGLGQAGWSELYYHQTEFLLKQSLAGIGTVALTLAAQKFPWLVLAGGGSLTGYGCWSYANDPATKKRINTIDRALNNVWNNDSKAASDLSIQQIACAAGKGAFEITVNTALCSNIALSVPIDISKLKMSVMPKTPSIAWQTTRVSHETPIHFKSPQNTTEQLLEKSHYFVRGNNLSPKELLELVHGGPFKNLAPETYLNTIKHFIDSPESQQLLASLPRNCHFLGVGWKRIALLTPEGEVAVIGPKENCSPCPLVLQPSRTVESTENYQLQILPYAENRQLGQKDLVSLCRTLRDTGWIMNDASIANIGKLNNGTLMVIDREAVTSRSRSINPAKPIHLNERHFDDISKLKLANQLLASSDELSNLYSAKNNYDSALSYKIISLQLRSARTDFDQALVKHEIDNISEFCQKHNLQNRAIDQITYLFRHQLTPKQEQANLHLLKELHASNHNSADLSLVNHKLAKLKPSGQFQRIQP